jgi:hypothetical protein
VPLQQVQLLCLKYTGSGDLQLDLQPLLNPARKPLHQTRQLLSPNPPEEEMLEQDSRQHSHSSFDISISLKIDHNRKRSKKHRTWITNRQPKRKPKKQTTSWHHHLQCDKQDLGSIHSGLELAVPRSGSTFAVARRIYGERGPAVPHEICSKQTSDPLPLRLRTVHVQRREKSLTLIISTQLCPRAQIPRFLRPFLQNRQPTAQHKTMRGS